MLHWLVISTGVLAWALAIGRALFVVVTASQSRRDMWLLDWHVYAAGARNLVDRTLYRVQLDYPGWPLPVDDFNLPPLAAAWALLLFWLPGEAGGLMWIGAGLATWVAILWILGARVLKLPYAWAVVGVGLAIYTRFVAFDFHVSVGNINDLMLGLIATFVLLHIRGHSASAGLVLGLAVATKVWPVVLAVFIIRERRWSEFAWFAGSLAVTTTLTLVWLGPTVVPAMIDSLRTTVPVETNNPVLWVTWLREHTSWWPAWGAVALAAALLVPPVRGRAGLGLAILAGVTLIPNLWGHYLPTIVFGIGLLATAVPRLWRRVYSILPATSTGAGAG